jgi:hypothetical protein
MLKVDQSLGDLPPDVLDAVVDVRASHPAGDRETPNQVVINAIEPLPRRRQDGVRSLALQQ